MTKVSLIQAFPDKENRKEALKQMREEYERYLSQEEIDFFGYHGWIDLEEIEGRLTAIPRSLLIENGCSMCEMLNLSKAQLGNHRNDKYLTEHLETVSKIPICEREKDAHRRRLDPDNTMKWGRREKEIERIITDKSNLHNKLNSIVINEPFRNPYYMTNEYIRGMKETMMKDNRKTHDKIFFSTRTINDDVNYVGHIIPDDRTPILYWVNGSWVSYYYTKFDC